ncbi:MAG: lactate utilization protein [Alistipes sp.]|nr:lactate utilization protein [Alistipes sp.]
MNISTDDLDTAVRNLTAKGYRAARFATMAEAVDYIDSCIDGRSVAFGGSVTLLDAGLFDRIASHNTVLWHWKEERLTREELEAEVRKADIYISSVNALTLGGEIVNIDGVGNRTSAIEHGHGKVFLLAGRNKLTADIDRAVHRARNVAAPLNARRLGKRTPCAAKADRCYDCDSPERICRILSILWRCPMRAQIEVLLVDEDAGC